MNFSVTEFQHKYPNKLGLDDKDKEIMMPGIRAKFSSPEPFVDTKEKIN